MTWSQLCETEQEAEFHKTIKQGTLVIVAPASLRLGYSSLDDCIESHASQNIVNFRHLTQDK